MRSATLSSSYSRRVRPIFCDEGRREQLCAGCRNPLPERDKRQYPEPDALAQREHHQGVEPALAKMPGEGRDEQRRVRGGKPHDRRRRRPARRCLGPTPCALHRGEQGAALLGAIRPTLASPSASCAAARWPRGVPRELPCARNVAVQRRPGPSLESGTESPLSFLYPRRRRRGMDECCDATSGGGRWSGCSPGCRTCVGS